MSCTGFSAARLTRLDQVMRGYVERAELPGLVSALERAGEEPHSVEHLLPELANRRVLKRLDGPLDETVPAKRAITYGMGVSVVTRRDQHCNVGAYGWDGGLGSSWRNDPKEQLIGVLLTQRAWSSPTPPPVCHDFWTLAYQALDG